MELDSIGAPRRRRTGTGIHSNIENNVPMHTVLKLRRIQPTLLLLLFLACVQMGASLNCYHCLERPKSTEKHLSCAYFDMSDKFHKNCTHSSFCMKRTSHFQLHNGSYVTIHVHKCADQSQKTMIQDEKGDWIWAQLFRRDLYNEGCFPHNTPSMLATDSYHCFCSTDFCNGASQKAVDKTTICLVTLSVLLAMLVNTVYLTNS